MCEFISWIEKENKVYYLTSADLASKRGKQLIHHCQNNDDLTGHGAIRWFYGEFKGGIDKECTDFTSPNNFPVEIVADIKAGKFKGMGICLATLNEWGLRKYNKIIYPAYAKYEKVEQSALAEYEKIIQPSYAKYEKTKQSTYYAEYKKIQQVALEEYKKIQQSSYEEYKKVRQSAFWDILVDSNNRREEWQ